MYKGLRKSILLLADGHVFHGYSFGKNGTATGEICFNTGMTGYQEVFTDPSYTGQVLIMNNVHIGNYGTRSIDKESNGITINALIVRNFESQFSRKLADESLLAYLATNNIVAIGGIDTRALVTHVRSAGAMNCIISDEIFDIELLKAQLDACPNMDGLELSSEVSTEVEYEIGDKHAAIKVAVLDLGIKQNILNCIVERGAFVKVFPAKTSASHIAAFGADGYFISNGPGDPAAMPYAVDTVRALLEEQKPLFGICLGHQLLALANGIPTFKMHNGHRGQNHPVKNLRSGICEITTQNHGFGIDAAAVGSNSNIEVTHLNLNDNSIEGIRLLNKPAFSVQYHPEAAPGPHDSRYLFDEFIALMKS